MYHIKKQYTAKLRINKSKEGETIERKVERIVNNKEPIKDGAPAIYTERKDGVKPEHDIRTDRFEIATEAASKISKSFKARREEAQKKREGKTDEKPKEQNDPLATKTSAEGSGQPETK